MRTVKVRCRLEYEVRRPTTFLFNIAARQTPGQHILEEAFTIDPEAPLDACRVGLEGDRLHRLLAEPGQLTLEYAATVQLDPNVQAPDEVEQDDLIELPAETLPYLYPSRYCESDLLARFAHEEFGDAPPGHRRVQAICDWVNRQLDYTPGSTTATTTASDVLLSRTGVCRDYAHLAVALSRALGVPTRYLSVYAVDLDPPDFHGVVEAYLGGHWYLFDPSRLAPLEGFVRIGSGRDAADVAFANVVGDATLANKEVSAEQVDGPELEPPGAADAVSLA